MHGIPSAERILHEGDIISLDCGTIYKGFVGDSAFTMGVGTISAEAERLLRRDRSGAVPRDRRGALPAT